MPIANTPAGVLMARSLQAANYGCRLLVLNPVTTYIVVSPGNISWLVTGNAPFFFPFFWDTLIQIFFWSVMKINDFRGELTDISSKKEAILTGLLNWHGGQRTTLHLHCIGWQCGGPLHKGSLQTNLWITEGLTGSTGAGAGAEDCQAGTGV